MQGWLCETLTGADDLRWGPLPRTEPGPGQVRVKVAAASLNFPDLLTVKGQYQFKPEMPFVPGSEFAGTVDALGPEVQGLKAGDRVACLGSQGGFGTHALLEARTVVPIPEAMPWTDAAAFLFAYGTSWHSLMDRAELKSGETVLVLGAAGGVGSAAVQIAKAADARVIAAASTPEKCAFCRTLGADETIDYSREDLRAALKTLTGGRGPDVIYDPVGGALAEPAFRSIGWRGRYLVVGFAGGAIPALPWNLTLLKGASIVGIFWGDFVRREPEAFAADLKAMYSAYAGGRLKPAIDTVLPMSQVREAYARMGSRQVMGKVVLVNEG
ncbi:MAG: NADPH:quinone oxidoreductase family protein [Betaproteobacteria bacterium]|jgi:NADPH2:quinone reductase